jgi:hypothetical protein
MNAARLAGWRMIMGYRTLSIDGFRALDCLPMLTKKFCDRRTPS